MKKISIFQTLEKYKDILFEYGNVKNNLTPIKIDKLIFLTNIELKRRGHENLIRQISYIENGDIRHGYLSTQTRIMPYEFIGSGIYAIYLTGTEKRVIRKLLRLDDDEFESLYQSELSKNWDMYNNVKVSKFKKYIWKIRARERTYTQIKPVKSALWSWVVFFQLLTFFSYIVWLVAESPKTGNSYALFFFMVVSVPIFVTIFIHYLRLRRETIFESKILGNDDDTVLTLKKYKTELKKLKKQKKIKKNRV
jgi:hypothetical protein